MHAEGHGVYSASEAFFLFAIGFTVLLLLLEAALGVVLAIRARRSLGARFLASSLIFHALALVPPLLFSLLERVEVEPHQAWWKGSFYVFPNINMSFETFAFSFGTLFLVLIPAADLAFALAYPRPFKSVAHNKKILVLPFVVVVIVFGGNAMLNLVNSTPLSQFALWVVAGSYIVIAILTSIFIFTYRTRNDPTRLDRSRARFIRNVILVPMAVATTILAATLAFSLANSSMNWVTNQTEYFLVEFVGLPLGIFLYAIIPPLGMAYGVLRFNVVDWDKRVRVGVRRSVNGTFLAVIFLIAYVALEETIEALVTVATNSAVLGIIGATIITLGIPPVRQSASRLALKLVPDRQWRKKDVQVRRELVYRAACEELLADGVMSPSDRQHLGRLARRFDITESAALRIRQQATDALGQTTPQESAQRARKTRARRA